MDDLTFYRDVLWIQRHNGGADATVTHRDLCDWFPDLSKQGLYYHINRLIDRDLLIRTRHGHYCVSDEYWQSFLRSHPDHE